MFFQQLDMHKHNIALIDDTQRLTYAQLATACDQKTELLATQGPARKLIFLKIATSINSVVSYLAALRSKHAVMLLNPDIDDQALQNLIQLYRPNLLADDSRIKHLHNEQLELDKRLSLLLSTSGSTGSAKQVALSAENLQANASSICAYLPILASDTTITTLPLFYSYGLSVLHSHLLKGAAVVLTRHTFMNREFWQLFSQHKIASFAGVPHSYDMLLRLRFTRMDLPSLRYFTQAGGKLDEDKVELLANYARQNERDFFVMYGQTEATARMAYLATDGALQKPGYIGKAIPDGKLRLLDENKQDIKQSGITGELVYSGPNVMLGYAGRISELAEFVPPQELHTGDLAIVDAEGDYKICGRIKRFIKVFGQRLDLDEVESLLKSKMHTEGFACGSDSGLIVAITTSSGIDNDDQKNKINSLKTQLSQLLQIHHSAIHVLLVDELPIGANGKKDYPALMALAAEARL